MVRFHHRPSLPAVLAATLTLTATLALHSSSAKAQITPDQTLGSEGSVVTPDVMVDGALADRIDGGATRGTSLFHSFIDFNVLNNQRVYFADPSGVENIISRVTGNNVSNIYGTLGVDGTANLYLINPRGIIFGPDAQLDVSGSFLATTAESVNFADGSQFRATNPNAAPLVSVNIPLGVQFGADTPAAIVNEGHLAAGHDLHIVAGSVTSPGSLRAGGQVSVEGTHGDVQIRTVNADSALLSARGDLELTESQIHTTHDLTLQAQDTVRVRDSVATPVSITTGGDLTIRGEQGIDILALNHAATPFQSGGKLFLISDGAVSGDSHFSSGGDFSILTLSGAPGTFVSLYDPIISVTGNAAFGNYTGVSLKVEATGSITAGNITITDPDGDLSIYCGANPGQCGAGSDISILASSPALILRAGQTPLAGPFTPAIDPSDYEDVPLNGTSNPFGSSNTTFGSTGAASGSNISVGTISITPTTNPAQAGRVILASPNGTITLQGNVDSNGGNIDFEGNVVLGNTISVSGGAIAFDGTINAAVAGTQSLTVNGNTGVTFGDGTGTDTIGTTRLAALAVTGTTTINSNQINTTGNQDYNSDVVLGATTSLSSNAGAIAFDGTINAVAAGTQGLTVNGNTGVTFGDGTGTDTIGTTRLAALAVTGTTTINSDQINTAGNQTYNSAVGLNRNVNLTSNTGNIQFTNTIDSNFFAGFIGVKALTLDAGNDVIFNGALGSSSSLASLNVTADGGITAGTNLIRVNGNASFATSNTNADITAHGLAVNGIVTANTAANNSDVTFGTIANPVNTLILGTSNIRGNLAVVSSGTIAQAAGSSITTTGNAAFTTTLPNVGDVVLRNTNPNFVLGPSDVGGNLTLIGNNSTLTQAGGGTGLRVAGSLNLIGIDDFSGLNNGVFGLSAVDSLGNVVISQPGSVDVATALQGLLGNTAVNGNLTIQATSQGFASNFSGTPAITLDQAGNNFGGRVSVNTPIPALNNALIPEIVQSGAFSVAGTTTLNANTGNILLNNFNNSLTGSVSLAGVNTNLAAATAIDLNNVNLTGSLNVTSGGNITDSGTIIAGATTLTANPFFIFGAFGDITLDDPNNRLGALTLNGVNITVVEDDAIEIASIQSNIFSPTNGNLTLTSTAANADIFQTGSINTGVNGLTTLTTNGGNIILSNAANRLGTLVLDANNVTIADSTAVNFGLSDINANLSVTSGGAITQSGVLTVGGTTTLIGSVNQPIILDNAANNFGGLITLSPNGIGSVVLVDNSNNTQISGFSSNGSIDITNNNNAGSISTQGAISANFNLTLTANTINLNGNSLTANPFFGTVRLQPFQPNQALNIGSALTNALSGRFIVIGRDNGTGDITITNNLNLNGNTTIQGGSITANGNITTNGNSLTLIARAPGGDITTAGQQISTTAFGSNGGNVTMRAENGDVTFGNINTSGFGAGIMGGNVLIQGNAVSSTGAVIDPYTGGGGGKTGNITIQAIGPAGNVNLSNVILFGDNYGAGGGGIVQITSNQGSVNFTNTDVISTNGGSGIGGDVVISAAQNFNMTDSSISTNGTSSGFAGNIYITAPSVNLDASTISAETLNNAPAGGLFVTSLGQTGLLVQGANININGTGAGLLTMQGNSLITARGKGFATPGGNIFIRGFAQVSALPANPAAGAPGNDIITSSQGPLGGAIDIQLALTPGFIVTQLTSLDDVVFQQLRMNGENNISSTGTIAVFDFSVFDSGQKVELSFVDVSNLVGNSCSSYSETSSFTIGGRGGLPTNPTQPLSSATDSDDWVTLEADGNQQSTGFADYIAQLSATSHAPQGLCVHSLLSQL